MVSNPDTLTPHVTPMMKQYLEVKSAYKDCILFFRLGDFYEMFFEDAHEASAILKITLTSRSRDHDVKIPMCGIPFHSAEGYIQKLLDVGKKIAICEQVSDPIKWPALSKGIFERKVVRVMTPSLTLNSVSLESRYLAAVGIQKGEREDTYTLSYVDIATGELKATHLTSEHALRDELARVSPKELLWPLSFKDATLLQIIQKIFPFLLVNFIEDSYFKEHPTQALFYYLKKCHYDSLDHIQKVVTYDLQKTMRLDSATIRNLELLKTSFEGQDTGSLLWLLDQTQTSMGRRLLKQWLLYPLLEVDDIKKRHCAVAELLKEASTRQALRESLKEILDLERIMGRLTLALANARDVVALKNAFSLIPKINSLVSSLAPDIFLGSLPTFEELSSLLSRALVEDPPSSLREGGMIRQGYHAELDELIDLCRNGKATLAQLEARERARTGISSLKVRYNQVFGYYIEITKANLDSIPSDYIRKQTLVNAERFITPELKDYENKILTAEERRKKLELELFEDLRVRILKEISSILYVAHRLATLDVLCSLAEVASRNHYVCPDISKEFQIEIWEGRHPVIEKILQERFVPNDICLNGEQKVLIITGPNMAGKSTVMRQVALIVLLAQIGSFVPAKKARMGVVDRIFTRVGAHDNLSQGESTFMVEMKETARILDSATSQSLILLDEIGRGTSTFDGLSIAWAVAAHIHDKIEAKTLFATHYHELTFLAQEKPTVKNFHISVKEVDGEVIFMRKLLPGGIRRSYGVQVARLAGLPEEVVSQAKEVLLKLETNRKISASLRSFDDLGDDQLAFFGNPQ